MKRFFFSSVFACFFLVGFAQTNETLELIKVADSLVASRNSTDS